MTGVEPDYEEIWRYYKQDLERLADDIASAVPDDGTLDGRKWCEENDVPEMMFAHAVEQAYDRFDYGVSPMHPWLLQEGDG